MKFRGPGSIKSDVCDPDQIGRILNSDHSGRSLRVLPSGRPIGVRQVSVLTDLRIGETATLVCLDLPDSVQNYLMHMGFVPDAQVTAIRRAPAGDPTVYGIDGMEIALRRETAESIRVRSNTDVFRSPKEAGRRPIAGEPGLDVSADIHEFAGAQR
jgi:ferrous iron transport protein A